MTVGTSATAAIQDGMQHSLLLGSKRASAACSCTACCCRSMHRAASTMLWFTHTSNPHGLTAPMLPGAVPHNQPLQPKPCASVSCSTPLSSCQTSQVCVLTMGQAHHPHLQPYCPGIPAPASTSCTNVCRGSQHPSAPSPPPRPTKTALPHPAGTTPCPPPPLEQHHLVCSPWVRDACILSELRSVDDVTPVGGK